MNSRLRFIMNARSGNRVNEHLQTSLTKVDVLTIVLTFMPSLWKRNQSPFWVCCYTNADGQRMKKSTKQKDRLKAWNVCLGIDRAEQLARAGNLTEQTAKKIVSEILERTTGQPLHNHKVDDWLEEWITGKQQSREGGHRSPIQAGRSGFQTCSGQSQCAAPRQYQPERHFGFSCCRTCER